VTRRSHVLKSNSNCETVHDAIWVDTETNQKQITNDTVRCELMQGVACYRRRRKNSDWTKPDWFYFTTINEYWDWVALKLRAKTRTYMFAHNWAFDAPVLDMFNVLPERGWALKSAVINSPPIILRWQRAGKTIQVVDTLNIWRMPLTKIGKSINLPKLDMPATNAPRAVWDTYNKRDVEIIMVACLRWFDFIDTNDLGGFASTLAAQAMRTYRHRFMPSKILIDDNEDALKLARESLHGGRCECHFIGRVPETIHKLDVNSQYPAIMATQYMPARLIGHYTNVTATELASYLTKYCIIADVRVSTNESIYAVVHDKRLVFPTGNFRTVLTTPELQYAIAHDHIIDIGNVAVYEREILFADYVSYFANVRANARAAGNECDAANAKIMGTSLFGKWAQKGIHYTKVADTDDKSIKLWIDVDGVTGQVDNMRQFAGIIERQEQETESRDSHPAIAAHITGHGRMQLWGLMQDAGHGNYYYSDTDSLWVNEIGAANVEEQIHQLELGKLKIEGVHEEVDIYGPKDYVLDGKSRIKGIRANAKKLKCNTFEQDKFTTLVGLLRCGDLTAPLVTSLTKVLRRRYTKGHVMQSGHVVPLRLFL